MQQALWIYLAFVNALAYLLMTLDKSKARRGAWRIPERTLLLAAAVGGALGAWIAMRTRRHKTKHAVFAVGIPFLFVLQAALLVWVYAR
ncbi:DUF1294 domain-containing protein [Cohnella caldifontis]|uniref:DUF1294 domain-containing protein n=1 Tax=Cohnella caldifontis TaxID=3027471 RepID=UPI0023ECB3F2|nr:DUF1294 domain-containing protein [Cohnella sp. YIM B05605]